MWYCCTPNTCVQSANACRAAAKERVCCALTPPTVIILAALAEAFTFRQGRLASTAARLCHVGQRQLRLLLTRCLPSHIIAVRLHTRTAPAPACTSLMMQQPPLCGCGCHQLLGCTRLWPRNCKEAKHENSSNHTRRNATPCRPQSACMSFGSL